MTESLEHNYIMFHKNSLTGLNPTDEIYFGIKGCYKGKWKYSILQQKMF